MRFPQIATGLVGFLCCAFWDVFYALVLLILLLVRAGCAVGMRRTSKMNPVAGSPVLIKEAI